METEMTAGDPGQQVRDTRDDEEPRGEEMQAPAPSVLVEDVERAARTDRRRRIRKNEIGFSQPPCLWLRLMGSSRNAGVRSLPASPQYRRGWTIRIRTPVTASVTRLTATIQ